MKRRQDSPRFYLLFAIIVIGMSPLPAYSDYIKSGPATGMECSSYVVFDSCKIRRIDAVSGEDNQLHELIDRYSEVTEYNERNGMCHIRIANSWFAKTVQRVRNQALTFYEKQADGRYEKVDVENVSFPCSKGG